MIQGTTLEDHTVHTKAQWDAAVNFLEDSLYHRIKEGLLFFIKFLRSIDKFNLPVPLIFLVNQLISDLRGPGLLSRWVHWSNQTDEQRKRIATIDEILPILASQQVRLLLLFLQFACVVYRWRSTNSIVTLFAF